MRRGTEAEWTAEDPILANGEFGFEEDTSKLKIGDGATVWSSLSYFGGGTLSDFTVAADSGANLTIGDGDTLSILGTYGLSTAASATNTITVTLDNSDTFCTGLFLTVSAPGIVSGDTNITPYENYFDFVIGTGLKAVGDDTVGKVTLTINDEPLILTHLISSGTGSTAGDTTIETYENSITFDAGDNITLTGNDTLGEIRIEASGGGGSGTVTSVATSNGTFVNITGGTITTTGTITGDLSATGTASGTTFLRGDNTWAVPSGGGGGSMEFTIDGDAGDTITVEDATALIIQGDPSSLIINTTTDDAGKEVSIGHNDSGVAAGTYGGIDTIPVITVDVTGHITGVIEETIEFYDHWKAEDAYSSSQDIYRMDTLTFSSFDGSIDIVGGTGSMDFAWVDPSDESLKKNIKNLKPGTGFEILSQLQPRQFEWKKNAPKGYKGAAVGMIAQEVEKVLPSIVKPMGKKGLKRIEYDKLVPFLIDAIVELKAEVEELKEQNGE